jgi:mRNA interferase MazF
VPSPSRGEVWAVQLDPGTIGHEQEGQQRPCLVISDDRLNRSQAGMAIIVPITRTVRNIPSHVAISPPEGGLTEMGVIKCEQVRSISTIRLKKRLGVVNLSTLSQVGEKLKLLLNL